MPASVQNAKAIMAGYGWSCRVTMTAATPPFPAGVELVAHVRAKASSSAILATLSTANQKITRVDDNTIDISIPGADSAAFKDGSVVLDLVRTDTDPDTYVGFKLQVPVETPVTRGL